MLKYIHNILSSHRPQRLAGLIAFLPLLMLVSCADEPDVQSDDDVDFCVRAVWRNGLTSGNTTRALTATDILAEGTGDIVIDYADYPANIEVTCSDGNYFTLSKGTSVCGTHPVYWSYTPSYLYKIKTVIRHQLTFHATAQIDDPTYPPLTDELESDDFDYQDIHDNHMLFTLHHTKALLRFTFAVSDKYSKVRYILISGIKFNGVDYPVAPKVLKVSGFSPVAYCYLDPGQADLTTKTNTIECTYSIYDKDANFVTEGNVVTEASIDANAPHLTRQDVKARNTFNLAMVFSGSPAAITDGYYYDLKVTINPDYLYVLSDHDNNHITIE